LPRDLKPFEAIAKLGISGERQHQFAHDPRSVRDFRPVAHIIGLHIVALGAAMIVPLLMDLYDRNGNADGMLVAALLTVTAGLSVTVVTQKGALAGFSRPQAFLLTVAVWTVLPAFGALPFVFGEPHVSYTDAYFESISGLTTTGSTVFTGLDEMARGTLLWRAMLQWFGGLGVVIVAIIFLPAMRIGGMQVFHAVSMDVSGDVIPQATRMAADLLWLYLILTVLCILAYAATGMTPFNAICHAMTTVSTGGYGTSDASFGKFGPAAQYAAILFMALAAMPFVRFVELSRGRRAPLWRDTQIRTFLGIVAVAAVMVAAAEIVLHAAPVEGSIRASLFNLMSVITTTGFASTDYSLWSSFGVGVFFVIALVGGCSGSTSGAAKVFRFQVLWSALSAQIKRIRSPHAVLILRYQGRPVEADVVSSIMAFFFMYLVTIGILAILLSLMGLDFLTALTAPLATVTNVGPGLGPVIGPAGSFAPLPDAAKWLLPWHAARSAGVPERARAVPAELLASVMPYLR
jgi:trk system potassium uptake protein